MASFPVAKDCRLYYRTNGTGGPWLVCINGTAQSTHNWAPVSRRLASRCRVLVYDCRGQGQSDLGGDELRLDVHLGDLQALMAYLDIREAILVGLSHGAIVAAAFAVRQPQRSRALVLGSLADEPETRSAWIFTGWRHLVETGGAAALAWAVLPQVFGRRFIARHQGMLAMMADALIARNDDKALLAHFSALKKYPSTASIVAAIPDRPVLVVSGDDDPLVPVERAAALARLCRGRHLVLEATGHSLVVEAPNRFCSALKSFIGDLPDVTAR